MFFTSKRRESIECTSINTETAEATGRIVKGYSDWHTFINTYKHVIAAGLIGIVLAGSVLYYYDYRKSGYEVYFEGEFLGYVRDTRPASKIFDDVKGVLEGHDSSINVSSKLSFQKTSINDGKIALENTIEEKIKSGLYEEFTAYAIMIHGKEAAALNTEDDAKKVIEGIKKYFADETSAEGIEVVSVNIKDSVEVVGMIADKSRLLDVQTAVDNLTGKKAVLKEYEVKQGDTLWSISRSSNLKIEEIESFNPSINAERIKPGLNIKLAYSELPINVEVIYKQTSDENIAFDVKYINDSSILRGQTKVVTSGQYGTKRVVSEITKLNGEETSKNTLSSEVVKSPVTQVVARGTKELVGSGQFIWPVSGHVTSLFGSRGGHAGIDICAPQGTPIYAADGGTVIQAGWYYGYGQLIIIDHKNGYKTYYGHCSEIDVSVGQSVSRSQYIGAVGHTGDADGDHVHFEVRLNGIPQNPKSYLK